MPALDPSAPADQLPGLVDAERAAQGPERRPLYDEVVRLSVRLDRLHERGLRGGDSLSLAGEEERSAVRRLASLYRALPDDERRRLPGLLWGLAKLEVAAGDYPAAGADFASLAATAPKPGLQAEAHAGAFHAALERRDWPAAREALLNAAALDPARHAPFPLDKYQADEVLGAGGFGVAWLCRDRDTGARVVVKTLRADAAGPAGDVFREARALEALDHPGIVRLRHCGYADAARTRPYLVMDHFDSATLADHVRRHGPLPCAEALPLLGRLAEALRYAHGQGVLHRDVKPANVLVRRDGGAWSAKLIDFGLALLRPAGAAPAASTVAGASLAGTLDYAAPEQLGRLLDAAGRPCQVGPPADVYGFARTACFALTGTASPVFADWKRLPEPLADLLGRCLAERPENRPQGLGDVLAALGAPAPTTAPVRVEARATPAPQVPPSPLPPLPADILELEGRLEALERLIAELENGTNESIRPHEQALRRSLGDELATAVFGRLRAQIEREPNGRVADLCGLAPEAPAAELLPLVAGLRALVMARRDAAEARPHLLARQEEDFRAILDLRLAGAEGDEFPIVAWLALGPLLAPRRYRFAATPQELVRKAEEHFQATRQAERDWREAERSCDADAYAAFRQKHPDGPRAAEAARRELGLLRRALGEGTASSEQRTRYLALRGPEGAAADRAAAGWGGTSTRRGAWAALLLSAVGAPSAALAAGLLAGWLEAVSNWWVGALVGGGLVGAVVLLGPAVDCGRRGWLNVDYRGEDAGGALIIGGLVGAILGLCLAALSCAAAGAAAGATLPLLPGLWLTLRDSAERGGRYSGACRAAWRVTPGGAIGVVLAFVVALAARMLTGTAAAVITAAVGGTAGGLVSFLLVRRQACSAIAEHAGERGPISPFAADRALMEL
jgi:serine/threonine protein kinase